VPPFIETVVFVSEGVCAGDFGIAIQKALAADDDDDKHANVNFGQLRIRNTKMRAGTKAASSHRMPDSGSVFAEIRKVCSFDEYNEPFLDVICLEKGSRAGAGSSSSSKKQKKSEELKQHEEFPVFSVRVLNPGFANSTGNVYPNPPGPIPSIKEFPIELLEPLQSIKFKILEAMNSDNCMLNVAPLSSGHLYAQLTTSSVLTEVKSRNALWTNMGVGSSNKSAYWKKDKSGNNFTVLLSLQGSHCSPDNAHCSRW
jgi:hypothetical protein